MSVYISDMPFFHILRNISQQFYHWRWTSLEYSTTSRRHVNNTKLCFPLIGYMTPLGTHQMKGHWKSGRTTLLHALHELIKNSLSITLSPPRPPAGSKTFPRGIPSAASPVDTLSWFRTSFYIQLPSWSINSFLSQSQLRHLA